jgi:glyceraldehyde-3-phosphate dehydrogenase (NAD(P))
VSVKVAINGYTPLGKRIADAVSLQDDMKVIGVSKHTPDFEAELLLIKEYPLFVAKEDEMDFEDLGFVVEGDVRDLIDAADIVIDTMPPANSGAFLTLYQEFKKKAMFQSGSFGVCDNVFNSWANYESALEKDLMRIPNPDVTGLCRALVPIEDRIGLDHISATALRGDRSREKGLLYYSMAPDIDHQILCEGDLRDLIPGIRLQVQTIDVPSSLLGLQSVMATLKQKISRDDLGDIFEKSFRIRMVTTESGVENLDQVEIMAQDLGRSRSDLYENVIWSNGIRVNEESVSFFQALDIASVVPENVDCVRAMMGVTEDKIVSIEKTDKHLAVNL